MDKYTKLEVIGKDTYGKFSWCLNTETRKTVLIKADYIGDGSEGGVPSSIISKISLLKVMEHPLIVRLLDIVHGENDKKVYQIFECTGRDLKSVIKQQLPQIINRPKRVKILRGIAYYHSNKILHGRLNPRLVMIDIRDKALKVKLADVGMDVSPSYKAPEILLGFPKYSFPADVWSIGCIFAEMVNQKPLFNGPTEFIERISIFWKMGTPSEETLPGVTTVFEHVQYYPKSEPKDLAALVPGLEPAGVDLLQKMLRINPKERITVDNALKHYYFRDVDPLP